MPSISCSEEEQATCMSRHPTTSHAAAVGVAQRCNQAASLTLFTACFSYTLRQPAPLITAAALSPGGLLLKTVSSLGVRGEQTAGQQTFPVDTCAARHSSGGAGAGRGAAGRPGRRSHWRPPRALVGPPASPCRPSRASKLSAAAPPAPPGRQRLARLEEQDRDLPDVPGRRGRLCASAPGWHGGRTGWGQQRGRAQIEKVFRLVRHVRPCAVAFSVISHPSQAHARRSHPRTARAASSGRARWARCAAGRPAAGCDWAIGARARTKVPAHDAVPRGVVLLVKLLLYVCGDILLDVELLQRLRMLARSGQRIAGCDSQDASAPVDCRGPPAHAWTRLWRSHRPGMQAGAPILQSGPGPAWRSLSRPASSPPSYPHSL